jgi:glycosyltransferase involved in cell wall biosynthesis
VTVPMTGTVAADASIAVVIPCHRVTRHIFALLNGIGREVRHIIVVDDCCPDRTGELVTALCRDPRVVVITHAGNLGVGGAVMTGYRRALELGADIVVKLDGDGQMDPALIPHFVAPILDGQADYTKGNRFTNIEDVRAMPPARLFGNAVLSFVTKASSGYWTLFDPTNGYTAIHAAVLARLPLDKIRPRYFFESDMLFRLGTVRACVIDIPMTAIYGDEESGLRIGRVLGPFLTGNLVNAAKRVLYNYFLRDFSIASVQLLIGIASLVFALGFGVRGWIVSAATGATASTGTVMLAALPVIVGMQLLLSFLAFDIAAMPNRALHPLLTPRRRGRAGAERGAGANEGPDLRMVDAA